MNQWIVLFCILNNEDKIGHIISLLKEEYFYEELPRKIYLYIIELVQKNIKIDKDIIKSRFEELQEQLDLAIDIDKYEEFIENLRKQFVTKKIKELGINISSSEDIDEPKFINHVNSLIDNISTSKEENLHNIEEVLEEVEKQANSDEEEKGNISFGIKSLDDHTTGLYPGDYIIIAGRPSTGKSGLMAHIAKTNALNQKPVILFSLEMTAPRITTRIVSNHCDMELWKLKRIKNRSIEEQKLFTEKIKELKTMKLKIDTTPIIDVNTIRSILQKIKMEHGEIGCIIVDYLQLMSGEGNNDNSRVSKISKNLKGIAIQYNCPVIAGSQLSRMCEQRDNKRPILSDLRDSGGIEQDADIVIMLYRDHYYNYNPNHERVLELMIRKFRNGEVGKIIVDYNVRKQTFKTVDFNTKFGKTAERFMYE